MKPQIPLGPDDLYCPYWRKKMSKVCHTCPMWTKIKGQDPNQKVVHETWNCAIAWLPTTTLETAQQARHTEATVAKARDDILASNTTTHRILAAGLQEQQRQTAVIENHSEALGIAPPQLKEIGYADRKQGPGAD